jgi:hypothetical protein
VKAKRTTSQTARDSSPGRPPRNANTRAWGKASATATSFAVGGGASAGKAGTGLKPLSAVTVRRLGAQVRDSDGILDDFTAGLVVGDDTTTGDR